eukprot:783259-Pleurochrysis_carterae.AAC.1
MVPQGSLAINGCRLVATEGGSRAQTERAIRRPRLTSRALRSACTLKGDEHDTVLSTTPQQCVTAGLP